MKVEADLRNAIRAVASDRKRARYEYEAKDAAMRRSVSGLMKAVPAAAKVVKEAKAKISKHLKLEAEARKLYRDAMASLYKYGLKANGAGKVSVDNEDVFRQHGGNLDGRYSGSWTPEQVIAELVAAPEKEKAAILKKYGIIWS